MKPNLAALTLALLLSTSAEAKWYEVEVLVFSHVTPAGLQSEVWPRDVSVPHAANAIDILAPSADEAAAESAPSPVAPATDPATPPVATETPFQPLPTSAFRLADAERRLAAAGYTPMLHLAWRQPVKAPDQTLPLRVYGGQEYPSVPAVQPATSVAEGNAEPASVPEATSGTLPEAAPLPAPPSLWELEGLLRLSASPFLNLESQLALRLPAPAATARPEAPAPGAATIGNDATTAGTGSDAETPVPTAAPYTLYGLNESRRLKSFETTYIDHPLMGILVQVRPYELPAGSDTDATEVIDEGKAADADPNAIPPSANEPQ